MLSHQGFPSQIGLRTQAPVLLAAAVGVVVVVPVVAAAVVAGAGAVVLAAVVEVGSVVVEAGRVVETVVGSAVVAGCVVTGAPVVGRWLELSGHVMPAVLMSEMSGYGLRVLWGSNGARGLGVTVPSTCWKGACSPLKDASRASYAKATNGRFCRTEEAHAPLSQNTQNRNA